MVIDDNEGKEGACCNLSRYLMRNPMERVHCAFLMHTCKLRFRFYGHNSAHSCVSRLWMTGRLVVLTQCSEIRGPFSDSKDKHRERRSSVRDRHSGRSRSRERLPPRHSYSSIRRPYERNMGFYRRPSFYQRPFYNRGMGMGPGFRGPSSFGPNRPGSSHDMMALRRMRVSTAHATAVAGFVRPLKLSHRNSQYQIFAHITHNKNASNSPVKLGWGLYANFVF